MAITKLYTFFLYYALDNKTSVYIFKGDERACLFVCCYYNLNILLRQSIFFLPHNIVYSPEYNIKQ